ncbi:MAG: carbonic anhydrase family protein [Myxococcota bacterium]
MSVRRVVLLASLGFGPTAFASGSAASNAAHTEPAKSPKAAEKGAPAAKADKGGKAEDKGHEEAPHWTYEGETGPAHWAELSPEWATCGDGHAQTPIDLNTRFAESVGLDDVVLHYHPTDATVVNNGHTIQVDVAGGNAIELDGEHYDLAQFHLHTPSEHRLDGQSYEMELHLVHKDARGNLAVIGVFLQPGPATPALDEVFDTMAGLKTGKKDDLPTPIDPLALLPHRQAMVRYSGSLTTPPCSEGVRWIVMTTPITVSPEQIVAFHDLYEHNARPLQALRGRAVLVDATP